MSHLEVSYSVSIVLEQSFVLFSAQEHFLLCFSPLTGSRCHSRLLLSLLNFIQGTLLPQAATSQFPLTSSKSDWWPSTYASVFRCLDTAPVDTDNFVDVDVRAPASMDNDAGRLL